MALVARTIADVARAHGRRAVRRVMPDTVSNRRAMAAPAIAERPISWIRAGNAAELLDLAEFLRQFPVGTPTRPRGSADDPRIGHHTKYFRHDVDLTAIVKFVLDSRRVAQGLTQLFRITLP